MLKVTLLGTGGTQPLPDRALAAAAVTVGGRSVLLDCGEGTQVGLRRYGVSAYRLSAVLLTHYHGDHILGLPGLLQTLGSLNRTEPLTIYGPKGIEPVAQAVTALAGPQAYPVRWQVADGPFHIDTLKITPFLTETVSAYCPTLEFHSDNHLSRLSSVTSDGISCRLRAVSSP